MLFLGYLKYAFGFVNGEGKTGLAKFGTVGAAEDALVELGNVVAWALFAWA